MAKLPDRLTAGETRDLRGWLNALRDFALSLRIRVDPSSGLVATETPGATILAVTDRDEGWIKLTGRSGSAYAWTRVYHVSGTTWADLSGPGASGTTSSDPAYEATKGDATIDTSTSPRAWARRDRNSGQITFEKNSC